MDRNLMLEEFKDSKGNVYCELGYDPEHNWGLTNWIGYVQFEDLKTGAIAMIELMKEHNIKNWLNDNREVEGSWDNANDWIASYWMPRVIEAGLKKYSVIIPEDLFAKLSTEFMADNAEKTSLEMMNWPSEEQARGWLLES